MLSFSRLAVMAGSSALQLCESLDTDEFLRSSVGKNIDKNGTYNLRIKKSEIALILTGLLW